MAQKTFNLERMMADNNWTLKGQTEPGLYQVTTSDGQEKTFNAKKFFADQGVDFSSLAVKANSPETALNISPVGILDRGALALGNAKGKLGYLKNKFDDVRYDNDKGLVVNNKGVWQTVDPSGLGDGDAWDMTKELVKDVVDMGDVAASAVASGIGAAKGAALGTLAGPAGAVAGGLLGAAAGGGASEGLRSSLGRLAGTYQATPEEQLQDVGIEALLNMGGEAVGLGAKATLGMIGKSFKNIGANAAEASKDMLSEALGKITGAGPQATRTMMDQTDQVIKEIAQAKSSSRTVSGMVDTLRDQQLKTAEQILNDAPKALTSQFGKLKSQLVSEAANMPSTHIGKIASDALTGIEQAGILKRTADKEGNIIFKVMDDESAIKLRNQGQNAAILAPTVQAELKPIVDQLNKFTKLGEFKGSQAAATLMDLKKTINDVYRDMVGPTTSPSVKGLLDDFKTRFSQGIGQAFDSAGLTPQYMSTVNIYQKYADAVGMARRMAQQENGAENFVKKLVSDSGANRTLKDLAQDLSMLMGKEGSDKINSITTKEAAKSFSSWLPRTGLASQAGVGAAIAAAPATGGASLAAIPATSPKLMLNAVNYGQKGLKLIQSLNPAQRIQMLQNPELLGTFLRTTMTAASDQEKLTQQLTQQASQAAGVQ
jgi:hypothetical protein